MAGAWIWRARDAICSNARITDLRDDAVITHIAGPVPADPNQIEKLITKWVAEIPNEDRKEDVRNILRERLLVAKDDTAALGETWRHCESESRNIPQEEFDGRHVAVLRGAVCDAGSNGVVIGKGIIRTWISKDERREFSAKLAKALLGEDGKPCAPAEDYDAETKRRLRDAAGPPPAAIAPK